MVIEPSLHQSYWINLVCGWLDAFGAAMVGFWDLRMLAAEDNHWALNYSNLDNTIKGAWRTEIPPAPLCGASQTWSKNCCRAYSASSRISLAGWLSRMFDFITMAHSFMWRRKRCAVIIWILRWTKKLAPDRSRIRSRSRYFSHVTWQTFRKSAL